MNITNAETEVITGDKLEAIFNRQKELMAKYHPIEVSIGLVQTEDCPVNLHDKRGQARLKDFAWRATEEVAEAMEAVPVLNNLADSLSQLRPAQFDNDSKAFMDRHNEIVKSLEENMLHFQEELVDALHFLTEFTILSGITPLQIFHIAAGCELAEDADTLNELYQYSNREAVSISLSSTMADFVTNLGLSCNCLKNKAWKQTSMLTDIPKFHTCVATTWVSFIRLLAAGGLNPESIADLYLKKSQVNAFRQRSNY